VTNGVRAFRERKTNWLIPQFPASPDGRAWPLQILFAPDVHGRTQPARGGNSGVNGVAVKRKSRREANYETNISGSNEYSIGKNLLKE
jgi:hypothetical protein